MTMTAGARFLHFHFFNIITAAVRSRHPVPQTTHVKIDCTVISTPIMTWGVLCQKGPTGTFAAAFGVQFYASTSRGDRFRNPLTLQWYCIGVYLTTVHHWIRQDVHWGLMFFRVQCYCNRLLWAPAKRRRAFVEVAYAQISPTCGRNVEAKCVASAASLFISLDAQTSQFNGADFACPVLCYSPFIVVLKVVTLI